jgi:hypothetical protein
MKLHPIEDCIANANRLIRAGCQVMQQFNCAACGAKQTIEEINIFHTQGRCEECQHVTDMVKDGCNYLVIASTPEAQAELFKHTNG